MQFSRALVYACLAAGQWLMLFTSALFFVLFVSQYVNQEASAHLVVSFGGAGICLVLAGVCHLVTVRLQRSNI